jgi:hypothetical protein
MDLLRYFMVLNKETFDYCYSNMFLVNFIFHINFNFSLAKDSKFAFKHL